MADTTLPKNKMYHLYLKVDKLKLEIKKLKKLKLENKKLNKLLDVDEHLMSLLAKENKVLFQNQINCKKLISSRQYIKYTV